MAAGGLILWVVWSGWCCLVVSHIMSSSILSSISLSRVSSSCHLCQMHSSILWMCIVFVCLSPCPWVFWAGRVFRVRVCVGVMCVFCIAWLYVCAFGLWFRMHTPCSWSSAKFAKMFSRSGSNKLDMETLETLATLELIAYFITCQSVCYSSKTNQLGFFPSFLLVWSEWVTCLHNYKC